MVGSRWSSAAAAGLLLTIAAGCAHVAGGGSSTPQPAQPAASAPGEDADARRAPQARTQGPRAYNRVVTANAVTREGLFNAHRVDDKLLFEIPRSELDKDMLLLRRTAAGSPNLGARSSRVVRFELVNDKVVLRDQSFNMRARDGSPIARSVEAQTFGSFMAVFDIEAFSPDGSLVIDATPLFTTNRGEFVAVRGIVSDRTFIEHVAAFPTNINVTAIQTGQAPPPGSPGGTPPQATTAVIDWSLLKLPEEPMMPRLHDTRVGFISVTYTAYGETEHRAEPRRYIRRFRLEKQNPSVEISEPVQPIVFWIDRATPEWLIPWVEAGVYEWQPAFRDAGFSNAIIPMMAPDPEVDPDWSPHDARHSMIYWRASPVQNATGGSTADPRTGEILKAEVNMYHNVMNLLRNWYFVQASPLDPRALDLPLPNELMGRLVQYVVAHEVGHAIGFPHNFKASYTFPADSVRSLSFLQRMGAHTPTLMDYSRMNYVAQPEDNIPVDLLIPKVSAYDHFAVMWGHKPIPGARTPEDELPTLNQWARMQDTIPWYRYQTPGAPNDPGNVTEAVGNQDAVRSSTLALRNLERVAGSLIQVAERPGQDYAMMEELYRNTVNQWGRYMNHVVAVVGAADSWERRGTGIRFEPVSRQRQQEAMRFLSRNAFHPPAFLLDQEILRRIEAEGAVQRISGAQARVVNSLLAQNRLDRLVEYEALASRPGEAYTVAELATDLRAGIWSELSDQRVRVDVFRRNLQRAHLRAMDRVVNAGGTPSDARPVMRGELIELNRVVRTGIARAADPATRLHLEDVRLEIERILEPPNGARVAAVASPAWSPPPADDDLYYVVFDCFLDWDDGAVLEWHALQHEHQHRHVQDGAGVRHQLHWHW